jgi:hypothetical protein
VAVIRKWEQYLGVTFSPKETVKRVGDLRKDWLEFMKDPTKYVEDMRQVCTTMYLLNLSLLHIPLWTYRSL